MADRDRGERDDAPLNAAISAALVQVLHEFTGRGATRARTTIREGVVLCLMEHTLTRGEQALVSTGRTDQVQGLRREYQAALREPFVEAVQRLTGRTVVAYLSANHLDPDFAAEVFVLGGGSRFDLYEPETTA